MRELASRILDSKLTLFLRKIDLFFSLLHIVWAVVIIGAPIFMEIDSDKIEKNNMRRKQ